MTLRKFERRRCLSLCRSIDHRSLIPSNLGRSLSPICRRYHLAPNLLSRSTRLPTCLKDLFRLRT